MGKQIIEQINYKELQGKILETITKILLKDKIIFEDKLIVENALSLWVGCVLHMNNLWSDFLEFKGEDNSKLKSSMDFILSGLLYCPSEKIREEFK